MAQLQPAMFPDIEGPDFVRSDEFAKVAEDVLDRHGQARSTSRSPRLVPVAEAIENGELRILYLANTKPLGEDEDPRKHDVTAKCMKAPRLWHDVTGYDVAIWVREAIWKKLDEGERRGVLLHELLHVEVTRDKDDQPKLAIRKHDVEDFTDVIRYYGPIAGDSGSYVRAAALFSGQPVPLHPATAGLQRLANEMGTDITLEHNGRSATIHGRAVDPETGEVLDVDEDLEP